MKVKNGNGFESVAINVVRRSKWALLALVGWASMLQAHNLDTTSSSVQFAKDYMQTMAARAAANQTLMQVGDEFWVVMETTPGPGTPVGVAGYSTFYLPTGYQVLDSAYVKTSATDPRGFVSTPMKGAGPISIGDGPIGAKAAVGLTGFRYPSANILGVNEDPVTATGLSRGTIAGVYADTGIFYSTDPRTVFNSYGTVAPPGLGSPIMKNNSSDTIGEWFAISKVPNKLGVMNLWDSYQERAFGRKDVAPIIDLADGRGNAPWGMASAVAGPQSGYKWAFNFQTYTNTVGTISNKVQAGIEVGPWNRIVYPGSMISNDQPGFINSAVQGYAGVPAGSVGHDFATAGPLPSNVNAVRFAFGMIELGHPELMAVKVRLLPTFDGTKPVAADAFGGDAAGASNGKDHLWRYFNPTVSYLTPSILLQKTVADPLLALGGTTYFDITVANSTAAPLPNAVLTDTLPAGLTYNVAQPAVPAPTTVSGSIITWNLGTLLPGEVRNFRLYVKAVATGIQVNHVGLTSNGTLLATAEKPVEVDVHSLLRPEKTVTPSYTVPNTIVRYTLTVYNEGNGSNGTPLLVNDFFSPGFTYQNFVSATLNGATVSSPVLTITTTDTNKPVFTVNQPILPGNTFTIIFDALVGPNVAPGVYYNDVELDYENKKFPRTPFAPVTVGAGRIGDTIYRDWNGNGVQDPGEEGLPGVTVKRYAPDGTTLRGTTTTDADGKYLFTGLVTPIHVIKVDSGVPAAYTLTQDPDGGADAQATVTLPVVGGEYATNLNIDFGYHPAGNAQITIRVFEDTDRSGSEVLPPDIVIPGATVKLYTSGTLVDTKLSNASGLASFGLLAEGVNYQVEIDPTSANAGLVSYFGADPFVSTTPTSIAFPNLVGLGVHLPGFGFFRNKPASLGDTVFEDINRNGIYDLGSDSPLSNVTVRLYQDVNVNGVYDSSTDTLVATTASAADGTYLFSGLAPGSYLSLVDTADPDIPSNLVAGVTLYAKTLVANENYLTADFPFTGVLIKTVDKSFANVGETLTFNLNVKFNTSQLFDNLRVLDPIPAGTTYVAGSATASGGTYGAAYVPLPAVDGSLGGGGQPLLQTSITVNTTTVNVGSPFTVTVNVKNDTNTVANVFPRLTIRGGGDYEIATSSTADTVNAGPVGTNYSFQVTPNEIGEWTVTADAADPAGPGQTVWPVATSASVLVVNSGAGPGVVSWNLGSNIPGVVGETVVSGDPPGLFAFRGNATRTFMEYNPNTLSWTSMTDYGPTATNVGSGGALTTDGTLIYALAGGLTQKYSSYNPADNTWTALPDFGSNVGVGGELCYLSNFVYALRGDGTTDFQRIGTGPAPAWAGLAATPTAIGAGGSLTTDGTYIYALAGGTTTAFYRYNPAGNSWSSMASTPAAIGDGAALTRIGNYIYALRGGGLRDFNRYDIAANTWTAMTSANASPGAGASMATDGTSIYALAGLGRTTFWKYIPATNAWSVLTGYGGGGVSSGGAIVYFPGGSPNTLRTEVTASPTVTDGSDNVIVRVRYTAESAQTNIVPNNTGDLWSGVAYAQIGGPTLISADDDLSSPTDEVIYEYEFTVGAGAGGGSIRFKYDGNGTNAFPEGTSNSVHVYSPLSFQVTVNNPGPVSGQVINTGFILDNNVITPNSIPSNTTLTNLKASIGQYVWADLDADGVRDAGEYGLSGVIVKVYAADGTTLLATATTDAAGNYRVSNLNAGSYVVRTDLASYPADYIMTTTNELSFAILAGEQYNNANFGAVTNPSPTTGSIGDYVWIDSNGDGVINAGEPPLANVSVSLQRLNAGVWTQIATDTTSVAGAYEFTGLLAGDYKVVIDTASVVTSPYSGSFTGTLGSAMNPTYDLDGVGTPHVAAVTLATGSSIESGADFGYRWAGTIGDFLWYDTNGNGVTDETNYLGGPQPAPNATVVLYVDINGDGAIDPGDSIIGIQVTGNSTVLYPNEPGRADGQYLFEYLPPGNYIVEAGGQPVPSPVSGLTHTMINSNGEDQAVVLGTGGGQSMTNTSVDFGFIEQSQIGGIVWHDVNANAVVDPGEPRLSAISVYVYGPGPDGIPGNVDDVLLDTTASATDGSYSFLVVSGTYRILYNTSEIPATLSTATTTLNYQITVVAGTEITGLDFGRDNSGIIEGTVFRDVAPRATYNPVVDFGIANVTVGLYSDALCTTLITTSNTNASGLYSFTGIADGTSYVKVYTATLPTDASTPPTYDPDVTKDGQTAATVTGGGSSLANDFGYPNSGVIAGTIFRDKPVIGTYEAGDVKLSGITVELFSDSGFTTLIANTTTDVAGSYSFPDLVNSTYYVKVDTATLPADVIATPPTYDPDILKDSQKTVTLSSGGSSLNNDFGYQEIGTIAGVVFRDKPIVGSYEPTDEKLSGITVGLYSNPGFTMLISNTTTNAAGQYSFNNLTADTYYVQVDTTTLPADVNTTPTVDPDADLNSRTTVILSGSSTDNNFGYQSSGEIAGIIFRDTPVIGTLEIGDVKLSGITVGLFSDSGFTTLITSTTTNVSGQYAFSNLTNGTYYVQVDTTTLPSDVIKTLPTVDPDSMPDSTTRVILNAGGSSSDNNFGYQNTGTIAGTVFRDKPNVGVYEAGSDPKLSGITVGLYSDAGFTTLISTRNTDLNGQYSFADLTNGTYYLKVNTAMLPVDVEITPTVDPDTDSDSRTQVVLSNGGSSLNNNFGYQNSGAIAGTIFRDSPVVGIFEAFNDPKLAAVTVGLYSDSGYTSLISTTTTDASGNYSFIDLTDGTYYVKVDVTGLPTDVNATPTVDPDSFNDSRTTVELINGSRSLNNDFGYQSSGIISGTVFRDTPVIETFEPLSDVKLSGITVRLYSDSGFATLITSTTTNGSGLYTFANLTNGTYYLQVDTAGLPVDVDTTPTVDPDATKDSQTSATISSGGSSVDNNFGYKPSLAPEIAVKGPPPTNPELVDGTSLVDMGPASLCFSSSGTYTVRNEGTADLHVSNITINGTNAAHFVMTTTLLYPIVLAPGGNFTFTILFSAVLDGVYTANLHIMSDDADEASFDIALEGTGANRFFDPPGPALKDQSQLTIHGADYTAENHFFATDHHYTNDLGFAPKAGDKFTAVDVDPGYRIIGHFFDLPQNGVVAMAYEGVIYYFQANYTGGSDGNDLVLTNFTPAAPPAWAWMSGSKARNNLGSYSFGSFPGARQGAMHYKRPNGDLLAFGGYGYGSLVMSKPWYLNDLWEYSRTTGLWRFVKGSTGVNAPGTYGTKGTPGALNTPGARHSGASWVGCDNNFWIFGGFGPSGRHNDLWVFDHLTEEWTWKHGSNLVGQPGIYGTLGVSHPANTPGARQGAVTWASECDIWLFGGTTDGGTTFHNDLWRYSVYGGEWTWMGGPNTTSAVDRDAAHGTYGTKGTGDVNNIPGARRNATGWTTPGKFWLFGGTGFGAPGTTTAGPNGTTKDIGDMNDLWAYEMSTGKWTWVNGPNSLNSPGANAAGTDLIPTARSASGAWTTVDGKLWLSGGLLGASANILTYGPQVNDIWTYTPTTDRWEFKSGNMTVNSTGIYGNLGVRDARNHPSGRWTMGTMVGLDGSQWFFGGGGLDGFGSFGRNSDLWNYGIPLPENSANTPPSPPFPDNLIVNEAPSTSDAAAATMASVPVSGQLTGKDADGDIILFGTTSTTLSHGTLTLQSNGQWTYAPEPGYVGTDTFTFRASDYYGGQSPTRTLTITVATNPADADNDGIPDSYEQGTFGSTGADALGDADGDGQSNYFEYLAGTNPVDAAQTLTTAPSIAAGASANGGSFKLNLSHVRPGVNYHLETSSDLDVWSRIGTFTFSVSGSATIEDPTAPTGQPNFYRISLEAPALLP